MQPPRFFAETNDSSEEMSIFSESVQLQVTNAKAPCTLSNTTQSPAPSSETLQQNNRRKQHLKNTNNLQKLPITQENALPQTMCLAIAPAALRKRKLKEININNIVKFSTVKVQKNGKTSVVKYVCR